MVADYTKSKSVIYTHKHSRHYDIHIGQKFPAKQEYNIGTK